MANELLFRQGKLADLKANESTNKVAGSINFTIDEPAIYLDVAEENGEIVRKRIGSYIARFASIEELKTKLTEENLTPSQDTLYYAINENALLAYTNDGWKQLNAVSSNDNASSEDIKELEDEIDLIKDNVGNLTTSVENLQKSSSEHDAKIVALEEIVGSTSESGTLSERVATHETDIGSLKTKMADVEDELDQKANSSELTALETNLTNQISNSINAANAMRYMGTIGIDSESNVLYPTGDISVGDTYVATDKFMIGETAVSPGDLIIAKGEEQNNIIIGEVSWDIVTTGYNSAHNPSLTVDGDREALVLTDYAGNPIKNIKFEGSGNVVITADGDREKFVVGLQWGSF